MIKHGTKTRAWERTREMLSGVRASAGAPTARAAAASSSGRMFRIMSMDCCIISGFACPRVRRSQFQLSSKAPYRHFGTVMMGAAM